MNAADPIRRRRTLLLLSLSRRPRVFLFFSFLFLFSGGRAGKERGEVNALDFCLGRNNNIPFLLAPSSLSCDDNGVVFLFLFFFTITMHTYMRAHTILYYI